MDPSSTPGARRFPLAEESTGSEIVERAWEVQHRIEERADRVGKGKYGRVLRMARKPGKEEWLETAKITLAGILIVGFMGFAIFWLMSELPSYLGL